MFAYCVDGAQPGILTRTSCSSELSRQPHMEHQMHATHECRSRLACSRRLCLCSRSAAFISCRQVKFPTLFDSAAMALKTLHRAAATGVGFGTSLGCKDCTCSQGHVFIFYSVVTFWSHHFVQLTSLAWSRGAGIYFYSTCVVHVLCIKYYCYGQFFY